MARLAWATTDRFVLPTSVTIAPGDKAGTILSSNSPSIPTGVQSTTKSAF